MLSLAQESTFLFLFYIFINVYKQNMGPISGVTLEERTCQLDFYNKMALQENRKIGSLSN